MGHGTEIVTNPFPHFQVENVLSETWLSRISEHWPAPEFFNLEGHNQHSLRCHVAHTVIDGDGCKLDHEISILNKLQPADRDVWRDLIKGPIQALAEDCALSMAPFLEFTRGKYGKELYFDRLWLDDAPLKYQEHGLRIHTHYDHDPFWVLTGIIYLDDGDGSVPGTYLARHPDIDDDVSDERIAEIVLNGRRWYEDDRFVVETEVAMKRNAMLVMADGPISFHGVRPFKGQNAGTGFRRRTILFHLRMHPECCQRLFGLSTKEFLQAARRGTVERTLGDAVAADTRAFMKSSEPKIDKGPCSPGFFVHPILG